MTPAPSRLPLAAALLLGLLATNLVAPSAAVAQTIQDAAARHTNDDANRQRALLVGPRGLQRTVNAKGQIQLLVPPATQQVAGALQTYVTQPEGDTPLDKSKLQHLEVQGVSPSADGVQLDLGTYTGYIRVLSDDLVNVAIVEGHGAPPASPAILKKDWAPVDFRAQDGGGSYRIKTRELTVEITKAPFGVRMLDKDGRVLNEDDTRYGSGYESGKPYVFKRTDPGENFYGFGEQSRGLNKRGNSIGMWNTDAYSYDSQTKYLYTTIPFFLGLRNGQAYGILFDNTFRSYYEMASEAKDYYYFYANGGPLSYYFIAGPRIPDVLQRYTELTGRFKEPPLWSLGWQQSKWGYTRDDFLNVAHTYREKKIPLDVLHLDIDYMDAYRVFTWGECCADPGGTNREKGGVIGDPYAFMSELRDLHLKTIAINDPGVKLDPDLKVYQEGNRNDYWAKNPDGSDFVGEVWPKDSKFPDFTRPEVRHWWAAQHSALFDPGVSGIWLDMNEPAVFDGPFHTMPLDVRFDHGTKDHREVHNIFGFHETEATAEAFALYKPNQRSFILTRDMFAGSQRWAALWTGDNVSTWEHLKLSIPMNLNIGLSGVPMVGNDIGGFASRPTAELMARWLEVGAFLPFSRIHYDSDAKAPVKQGQEPWAYGPEVEDIGRRYISLRYALLPYLQNAYHNAAATGSPVWQPLVYQFQNDPGTYDVGDQFMFGDRLLVAPVVDEGKTSRSVYLPAGTRWIDYWTGQSYRGGTTIERAADLGTVPVYVRADSIIPSREVQQYTDEHPLTDLVLDVWLDREASTTFYEDDGATLDYEKGAYKATRFTFVRTGRGVLFRAEDQHEGYDSKIQSYTLRIHEVSRPGSVVSSSLGAASAARFDAGSRTLDVKLPAGRGTQTAEIAL
ncbi:glycoside hydrolase family 31 protein [Frateuria defendens]|uniref:glycoside hydrolase family 31 protein n=1 Tax=Frateuria defendens TaxID=2219559 RepID=UPI00069FA035|nr:TIM-barrel domain-containing protein [Frateuria defendens]